MKTHNSFVVPIPRSGIQDVPAGDQSRQMKSPHWVAGNFHRRKNKGVDTASDFLQQTFVQIVDRLLF